MQLTLYTDYSLRVLMFLGANPERLCTAGEISEFHKLSRNHLVKIVHNLVKLGYVESVKGKGGGMRLSGKPDEINLKKLILEIEPNFNLVECFDSETNTCRMAGACGLQGVLNHAFDSFAETLSTYTLKDIIPK
ncbi:MAG: RrF2 family transcriptional regulator [Methyloligellaceae bacterium]